MSNPSGRSRSRKPSVILGKMIVVSKDQSAGFGHVGRGRLLYAHQDGNPIAERTGYFNAVTASDDSYS